MLSGASAIQVRRTSVLLSFNANLLAQYSINMKDIQISQEVKDVAAFLIKKMEDDAEFADVICLAAVEYANKYEKKQHTK